MQQISGGKGCQNLQYFVFTNVYYTGYPFFCSVQNAEVETRGIFRGSNIARASV
jgi:hypothetical protein